MRRSATVLLVLCLVVSGAVAPVAASPAETNSAPESNSATGTDAPITSAAAPPNANVAASQAIAEKP